MYIHFDQIFPLSKPNPLVMELQRTHGSNVKLSEVIDAVQVAIVDLPATRQACAELQRK